MAGLANKLSTGMEKNPCICPACRSMVTRWSAPAVVSRSATSRAMIGLRGLSTCTQQNIVTAATVVFRGQYTDGLAFANTLQIAEARNEIINCNLHLQQRVGSEY